MINTIKRYGDKEDAYLLAGVIICIALILWFQFIAFDWKEVVVRGQEVSDLIVNVSLSYMAGWIVYMISTFIPKIRDRKLKSETVKPVLKEIVNGFEFNIVNSLLIPNQGSNKDLFIRYQNRPLNIEKNDLATLISCIDNNSGRLRLHIEGMVRRPVTYKEQLICICLNQKSSNLKKLDKFIFLLNESALQLVNEVENSQLMKVASQQYEHYSDYCLIDTMFYDHYQAVVRLNEYINKKL